MFNIIKKGSREQKKLLKAIKKNPHDSKPLVLLGWILFDQKDFSEAKQYFSQAVELHSDPLAAADATYGLALLDLKDGKFEQVRDALREMIREHPDFEKRASVHFALGRANEQLWRNAQWKNEKEKEGSELLQRAVDHYEQALERRAEEQDEASFFLGKLYYDMHRHEESLPYLQRAGLSTTLASKDAFEANYLAGRLFLDVKQDLEKAGDAFEAALKRGAKQELMADLYRQLGNIALAQEDDDLTAQRYEQALSHYKDEHSEAVLEVLMNLSELKFRHHWLKVAIEYAERALQIPTESKTIPSRLLEVLAQSYYGIREYEPAADYEQQFFKSTKDPRKKAKSLLRLGTIYEHLEQMKQASDAYRKGLKFAKKNLEASKLNAAIGRLYIHEDRLNQAINHLKEAAEFVGDDAEHAASVYRLLGECHSKRKETERAIEAYGKIIADYTESKEEPFARQELKEFRKQFKKELQDIERAQMSESEDVEQQLKAGNTDELERLLEIIEEILDEKGFFERLKEGLAKTHMSFVARIEDLLAGRTSVDDELIENLEEALILSDIGVETTQRIIEKLEGSVARKELKDPAQIKYYLKREVQDILQNSEKKLDVERDTPFMILVIGVNGTGKTTTIGKLASKLKAQGKEVLLVAGDTFRAAAIEQLEIWGERTGCEVIKHSSGADPSAVMFDAIKAAKARNVDVIIADTAGRLHTKKNLMEELKKMVRVISREMPGAPHETLMVIDATTGQNAVSQAQLFNEGVGVSGLVLTKLDGTAKGGIIVGIANELNLPVTYIGIGEQVEDLREFQAKEFVEALFED